MPNKNKQNKQKQNNNLVPASMGSVQKTINKTVETLMNRTNVRGKKQSRAHNGVKNSIQKGALTNSGSAYVNTSFNYRNKIPVYTGVQGGVRIKHVEYVADLAASVTAKELSISRYNINPANSTLFPWLATAEGRSYGTFIPHSIRFMIKSVVSTSKDGSIFAVATADVEDTMPLTKATLLKTGNAVRSHIYQDLSYDVPKTILNRLPEYVTYTNPLQHTALDKAVGVLFVGSSGAEATLDYGELYVEYDITLLNPQSTIFSTVRVNNSNPGPAYVSPFAYYPDQYPTYVGNMVLGTVNYDGAFDGHYLKIHEGGGKIITIQVVGTGITTYGAFVIYDANGVNITTQIGWERIVEHDTSTKITLVHTVNDAPDPWFIYWFGLGASTITNIEVFISPWTKTSVLQDAIETRLNRLEQLEQQSHTEDVVVIRSKKAGSSPKQ